MYGAVINYDGGIVFSPRDLCATPLTTFENFVWKKSGIPFTNIS